MGILDNFKMPRIDAQKFRMNLVKNAARTTAEREVWPLLDEIGEMRFRALIERDIQFLSRVPYQQMPEKWRAWLKSAPQYNAMIIGVDESFILALLPDWMQVLVTRDQKSWSWFVRECAWLRSHFELEAPQEKLGVQYGAK